MEVMEVRKSGSVFVYNLKEVLKYYQSRDGEVKVTLINGDVYDYSKATVAIRVISEAYINEQELRTIGWTKRLEKMKKQNLI